MNQWLFLWGSFKGLIASLESWLPHITGMHSGGGAQCMEITRTIIPFYFLEVVGSSFVSSLYHFLKKNFF